MSWEELSTEEQDFEEEQARWIEKGNRFTRAEEEGLRAEADYWNGVEEGESDFRGW